MASPGTTTTALLSTRLTALLKCRHPLVLPGMSWISTPELVAAVTNAGGVGILATGPLTPQETRHSIRRIRELLVHPNDPTRQTFGIGATLLMPGATENAQVAIDEQVPLLNISLGKGQWIAEAVHEYGGHVLATVTNVAHAQSALESGADALLATGHEAAAHGGDVTSLVLIPSLAKHFPDVPLVAAGGFATGSGLAAALALGADGIAMGTRFAATLESPLPHSVKQAIVNAAETDTLYGSNLDGIPARVLDTPKSRQLMQRRPYWPTIVYRAFMAARTFQVPLWKVLPGLLTQYDKMFAVAQFGAATSVLQTASVSGDLKHGVQFVGQCQGLIASIEPMSELLETIVQDARKTTQQQARRFRGP